MGCSMKILTGIGTYEPEDFQDEDDRKIDGKPGRIEEGKYAIAGHELAEPGQVGKRLACVRSVGVEIVGKSSIENPSVQFLIHLRTYPDKHARTNPFKPSEEQVEAESDQSDHVQGHLVATAQHSIVHL